MPFSLKTQLMVIKTEDLISIPNMVSFIVTVIYVLMLEKNTDTVINKL